MRPLISPETLGKIVPSLGARTQAEAFQAKNVNEEITHWEKMTEVAQRAGNLEAMRKYDQLAKNLRGLRDTVAGFTSPAMVGLVGGGLGLPAIGAPKAIQALAGFVPSAWFLGKGVEEVTAPPKPGETPADILERRLGGASLAAMGIAGVKGTLKPTAKTLKAGGRIVGRIITDTPVQAAQKGYQYTIRALRGTKPNFPKQIERLSERGHMREFAAQQKPTTVREAADGLRDYMDQWENDTIGLAVNRHPGATLLGNNLASAIGRLKNPVLDALFPENSKVIDEEMVRYAGQRIPLPDGRELLAKLNAASRALQKMTPESKAAAERASMGKAVLDEVTRSVRRELYGTLDRLGEPGIREARLDYAAMTDLHEVLNRNIPRAERMEAEKPKYLGVFTRGFTYHPLLVPAIAGAVAMEPRVLPAVMAVPAVEALRTYGERAAVPNALLRKAMDKFAQGPERAPLPKPPGPFPMLPPGPLIMPPSPLAPGAGSAPTGGIIPLGAGGPGGYPSTPQPSGAAIEQPAQVIEPGRTVVRESTTGRMMRQYLGGEPAAPPVTSEAVAPKGANRPTRTDLLPSGWRIEVDKTRTKEGHTYEAEVDWRGKRLVFNSPKDMENPNVVNHEIAHVVIETLPEGSRSVLLDEYVKLKGAEWKAKGYKPEWITKNHFHREEIAMDYGNYLIDPKSVNPELGKLFERYLGRSKVAPEAAAPVGEIPTGTTPLSTLTRAKATDLKVGDTFLDEVGEPRRVVSKKGNIIRTADGEPKTYVGTVPLSELNAPGSKIAGGGKFRPTKILKNLEKYGKPIDIEKISSDSLGFMREDGKVVGYLGSKLPGELTHDELYEATEGSYESFQHFLKDTRTIRTVGSSAFEAFSRPYPGQIKAIAKAAKEHGGRVSIDLWRYDQSIKFPKLLDSFNSGSASIGELQRAIDKIWPEKTSQEVAPLSQLAGGGKFRPKYEVTLEEERVIRKFGKPQNFAEIDASATSFIDKSGKVIGTDQEHQMVAAAGMGIRPNIADGLTVNDFMHRTGAVRSGTFGIDPEDPRAWFEIMSKPTPEQIKTIAGIMEATRRRTAAIDMWTDFWDAARGQRLKSRFHSEAATIGQIQRAIDKIWPVWGQYR